ncbi:MAG: class I tRNA ligase family protein, partial [Nanoarchaeota archaeon]
SENILDKWIISRLNENIKNVTLYLEKYNADKATEDIENFVINDLSNWYVRRSRERVNPSSIDEKDRDFAFQTLWWVLNEYSRLLAPFIPFIAEEIYTNISGGDSVHLSDWPTIQETQIDLELKKEFEEARKVVELAHSQRKEAGIKVRQPLGLLETTTSVLFSDKVKKIIADEINVEEVKNEKGEFSVRLDIVITDDLKKKGEMRDIIRKIQEERKRIGTSLSEKINVTLPTWPAEFEKEIKRKALINSLSKGEFSVSKT